MFFCLKNRFFKKLMKIYTSYLPNKKRIRKEGVTSDKSDRRKVSVCQSVSRAFCLKNRIEKKYCFDIYNKNFRLLKRE